MNKPVVIASSFIAGGAALLAALYYNGKRKLVEAIDEAGIGGQTTLRLTGYWPFTAVDSEKKMEGGKFDRKGKPLYTLEQHQADPNKYPYVSLSGDTDIWPYGQRIVIPELGENLIFRVVDTGSHFHGIHKLVRIIGDEPIDVCVNSSKTKLPKTANAIIIPGDNFEGGKVVATARLGQPNPNVAGDEGGDGIIDAFTNEDAEALARMISSELPQASETDQLAAAWATKNRAADSNVSIHDLLCPNGYYGPQDENHPFASTRVEANDNARAIADKVLASSNDPTNGAIDFWCPKKQDERKLLGDLYRVALSQKNYNAMKRLESFKGYTKSASDLRSIYAQQGMRSKPAGGLELLVRV